MVRCPNCGSDAKEVTWDMFRDKYNCEHCHGKAPKKIDKVN